MPSERMGGRVWLQCSRLLGCILTQTLNEIGFDYKEQGQLSVLNELIIPTIYRERVALDSERFANMTKEARLDYARD